MFLVLMTSPFLQEMGGGCGDWMELAQDRDRWGALVSAVMNLLLILILKALQLQGSFGLLNEFFPFEPVSDAVPPVRYFHICYVTLYIILPSIFRSS